MTEEQAFFLTVLRHHLDGEPTAAPTDLDFTALYEEAAKQQLAAVLYRECKDFIPQPIGEKFRRAEAVAMQSFANRQKILAEIDRTFADANLPYTPIKGALLSSDYPVPFLRTMGDVDLLLFGDRKCAHQVLTERGFTRKEPVGKNEWVYLKNGTEIELHTDLLYPARFNPPALVSYFQKADHYRQNGNLDASFHFLFVLAHLRKHFVNTGVGFRPFYDVAVLIKNRDDLNWDFIRRESEMLGLLTFAERVFFCCREWFGTDLPFAVSPPPDPDFCTQAADKIFADGIFGYQNPDHRTVALANRIRMTRFPLIGKIRLAIARIFPSYRTLCSATPYAFLIGKPYLLPIGWFYHFYRGIFHHSASENRHLVTEVFLPQTEIDKRNDLLSRWGL